MGNRPSLQNNLASANRMSSSTQMTQNGGGLSEGNGASPEVKIDKAEFYYDIGKRLMLGKEEGMEVNRNVGMAIDYLQRAAEEGHAAAEWDLASLVGEGEAIKLDFAKAMALYKKHAKEGHTMAYTNLGVCYHKGRGIEKNTKKAVSLYQKAVAQGYPRAMYNLALCYDFGEGVTQDVTKAVELYYLSALGGYAVAQHYMGVCYFHGKGVKGPDLPQAIQMWRMAAQQGHPYAVSCMGESFRDGQGVDKDMGEAARCFAICSSWGIEEGWQSLQDLLNGQTLVLEDNRPRIVNYFYERKLEPEHTYHVSRLYDQLCFKFHKQWAKEGVAGRKHEQEAIPLEVCERVKYGASTCVLPSCGKYFYGRARVERRFVLRKEEGGTESWDDDVVLSFCSVKCSRYDGANNNAQQEEGQSTAQQLLQQTIPLLQQQTQQQAQQAQQQLQVLTQLLRLAAALDRADDTTDGNTRGADQQE